MELFDVYVTTGAETMRKRTLMLLGILCCLGAVACGGGGGGGGELAALVAEIEGIYSVDDFTRNSEGCGTEGGSVLAELDEPFLVVTGREALGRDYALVFSCTDVADCRVKAGEDEFAAQMILQLWETDGEALTGTEVGTGWSGFEEGLCTEPELKELSVKTVGDDGIRVETRVTVGDDYPEDEDGFCTTDGGAAATKGKPCATLEVLSATFEAAL